MAVPPAELRPMAPEDVRAAHEVAMAALSPYFGELSPADLLERAAQAAQRLEHLRSGDPGGAWIAEHDGRPVGVAIAIVREGLWGLSLLAVRPDVHARGVGGALLARALEHGDPAAPGLIVSSPDPRALRLYARAGFAMRPFADAAGIVERSRVPAGAIDAGGAVEVTRDRGRTERASRHVRGASHVRDIGYLLRAGHELLAFDGDRGFAVHDRGTPKLLAAVDEEAASGLLWSVLARSRPGTTVSVEHVGTGGDWATRIILEAGLPLTLAGALFVRGEPGPLQPYLPSGAFL